MRASLGLALAVAFALVPSPVSADIYRWIDDEGVEHYTNVKPSRGGWQRVVRSQRGSGPAPRRRVMRAPDPERLTRYNAFVHEAAQLYQLPEAFIHAVMRVESNYYADAVSAKGAMGLMQLMPNTAASMGVVDAFDPRQNVLGGARFLRVLANRFGGDLVLTVAAYNAGQGAVEKYRGVPPYAETRRYVQRVLSHYYQLLGADKASPRYAQR